jgi:hypothetical protein
LTGWAVAADRRPSPIAGRGWFAAGDVAEGAAIWHGDSASVPMNHSCDPNLWWSGSALVARRAIAAGDEFTVDYSTSVADPSFLLACHCESYRCRQMVTGEDWRIPELRRRYAGHWAESMTSAVEGESGS